VASERNRPSQDETEEQVESSPSGAELSDSDLKSKRNSESTIPRGRGRVPRMSSRNTGQDHAESGEGRDERRPIIRRGPPRHVIQARRARAQAARAKLEAEGVPSTTSVFVANLSYKVGDAELETLFSNLGIDVVSAKVVRANSGRPRGFGFVDFASDADQLRAVEEVDGMEMEGRSLAVKVALKLNSTDGEDEEDIKGPDGIVDKSTPEN
jgi:hypothetical protein